MWNWLRAISAACLMVLACVFMTVGALALIATVLDPMKTGAATWVLALLWGFVFVGTVRAFKLEYDEDWNDDAAEELS